LEFATNLITIATAAATATAATTAAAATATAAEFTTTTAAATAAGAFFTRASNVNREGASIQLLAVHGINGFLRFFRRTHGDECEAARAAAHPVHHQVGFNDRAVRSECVLEVVFGGVEGKISNKQFRTHVMSYCPNTDPSIQTVPDCRVSIITEPSSLEDFHAVELTSYLYWTPAQ
jgi:hypothetical protein